MDFVGRYLCSELVKLKNGTTVNLEEIWEDGAGIESDDPLNVGDPVALLCADHTFEGTVTLAAQHEFGWRIEIAFNPGTKWTLAAFHPQHVIDPDELAAKKAEN